MREIDIYDTDGTFLGSYLEVEDIQPDAGEDDLVLATAELTDDREVVEGRVA